MARVSKLLDQEVALAAAAGLRKLGEAGLVARKLQAILAAKKRGITKAAEFYYSTPKAL